MSDQLHAEITKNGENIIKNLIDDVATLKAAETPILGELGAPDAVTISGGVIVIPVNSRGYLQIETEGGAVADDLDEIQGGSIGKIIILESRNSAHVVTCKDGVTNLNLAGDFSLDNTTDKIMLIQNISFDWDEISRSNNT